MQKIRVYIRENSWLAGIAAHRMGWNTAALVWGHTIHLYGTTAADFMENASWLRHELQHVLQYEQRGIGKFLWQYLLESLRNGYYNNALEAEARAAEQQEGLPDCFEIIVSKKA